MKKHDWQFRSERICSILKTDLRLFIPRIIVGYFQIVIELSNVSLPISQKWLNLLKERELNRFMVYKRKTINYKNSPGVLLWKTWLFHTFLNVLDIASA